MSSRYHRNLTALRSGQAAWEEPPAFAGDREDTVSVQRDAYGQPVYVVYGITDGAAFVIGVLRDATLCDTGYTGVEEETWRANIQRDVDYRRGDQDAR